MLRESVEKATGGLTINYEGNEIDFSNFRRIAMRDAIEKFAPGKEITPENMIGLFDEFVEPISSSRHSSSISRNPSRRFLKLRPKIRRSPNALSFS
jgi:lysyl-tRNA synthetase class II